VNVCVKQARFSKVLLLLRHNYAHRDRWVSADPGMAMFIFSAECRRVQRPSCLGREEMRGL
jgi:hypothetical protein